MKNNFVNMLTGGGGSPEQSQAVFSAYEIVRKYEQLSARRGRPRSFAQARTLAFSAKGGEPARAAFTMAEILLSLTIIGVVAAITLPSLTGNINERTWNTQRKALYSRMSQAVALMPALNGYGTYTEDESGSAITDTAAETFVTAGLSKVLKINNICSDNLADCGFASSINTLAGKKFPLPTKMSELNSNMVGLFGGWHTARFVIRDTKAAAFETQNGESILVFYNPNCIGSLNEVPFTDESVADSMPVKQRVCANLIYDLNGSKGPNTVNKDIGFMTLMYPFDAQLFAPYPATKPLKDHQTSSFSIIKACTKFDPEYRAPKGDELLSMFVNKNLIDAADYSETMYLAGEFYVHSNGKRVNMGQSLITGERDDGVQGGGWCIKR
ncbi:MAG: type II secretion system GspH family protein [Fusobacterium sp.]|nr:type II secretion system GspH family protein [Fusobacterium sp.]